MAAYDRYPVRLRPVVLQKIWGGPALRRQLGKPDDQGKAGESWEISARAPYESQVLDGPAAGLGLNEYLARMGEDFYGGVAPQGGFPLLIKLIGPAEFLSVQVHPGDEYAAREGDAGKSEAWVVVDAPPDGQLVYGVNCTKEAFEKAIHQGWIRKCLRWLPVKAGDVVNIPAGTVHALGPHVLVYEIQQSSDTTYRVYDWDRIDEATGRPRELHVAKALDVIDWTAEYRHPGGLIVDEVNARREILISNGHFTLERIEVRGRFADRGPDGFSVWTAVGGAGRVLCADPARSFDVKTGDSFLIPACGLGLTFDGRATLLKGHTVHPSLVRRWLLQRGAAERELGAVDWR